MTSPEGLAALKIDRTRRGSPVSYWKWIVGVLLICAVGFAVPQAMVYVQGVEVSVAPATKAAGPGGAGKSELSAAGYVVADRQSVLAFKGTGRLSLLKVAEAQRVSKGELIAKIDHAELDAQILQAEAEWAQDLAEVERQKREDVEIERLRKLAEQFKAETESARAPLQRVDAEVKEIELALQDSRRKLVRDKALVTKDAMALTFVEDRELEIKMSLAKIDTAQRRKQESEGRLFVSEAQLGVALAGVKVAESRYASAVSVAEAQAKAIEARIGVLKAQLAEASIYAPFDGVVTEKAAEVGEIVAPISIGGSMARGSIATIAEWSSLQAEVDVAETYIGQVVSGQRASITVDAFPKKVFAGKVRRILPRANRSKATVQVRVDFIDRGDAAILPEMGVRVKFIPDDAPPGSELGPMKEKILAPKAALQEDKQGAFLWVVNDGKAEKRSVKAGAASGESVEIEEGIKLNEKVVIRGAENLTASGQKVRVAE